ncbi:SpoIID/LytB domain-containing protein [Mobilicoccus pelagius]|uniref:Sporulation stage II protein D amidase enhancer LytB N-terminal domain-containing protein n=1 Tax=Mobilicoccus pelagius NBRC 104925 TaxID=1089455 RepID=H5URU3_9MICO|nr:SpoIID/LytB domain-containing protein [Mobilicoccus pelagius]GAB48451.1 hypothetical protein MOPEL_073_00920 [Mobilicoccus pelagius NBRC 104925]
MSTPAARLARRSSAPALALALLATGAPAASADPVVTPGNGDLVVDGRGFGHGRGMSQWGAYGAADAGLAWPGILDFYYPGARRASQPDSEMRVWISRDGDGVTELPARPGLRATVGRRTIGLPADAGHTAWRAFRSGDTVVLQYRDAHGTWRAQPIARTASVVFSSPTDTIGVTMPGGRVEEFPGRVMALTEGGRTVTVVATSTERYLRGVVPNEMPASWHPQAVAAQSVAARTYASSYRAQRRRAGSVWDICDTVRCQVYRGTATATTSGAGRVVLDDARATAAIALTSGTVLETPGGNFLHAEFSASNGGHTVDGGAFAQVAKPDPYDARMKNPSWAWNRSIPAATFAKAFGLGRLTSAQVVARDGRGPWGGRVTSLRLTGTTRTVDVSGDRMRQVLGLRSSLFTVTAAGGGTAPSGSVVAGPRPSGGSVAVVAEWTGDRTPDRLRVSNGRLVMERGLGRGRYARATVVPGSPRTLTRVVGVGDVDHDRRADVVAVDDRDRLVVLRGNGSARVVKTVTLGPGWGAFTRLEVRDVTKDHHADVVATTSNGRRVVYAGTSTARVVRVGTSAGR